MTAPTPRSVAPPPERFNFAAHLIERNTTRAEKLAYIDDQGSMTYGELADRVRRFAAALAADVRYPNLFFDGCSGRKGRISSYPCAADLEHGLGDQVGGSGRPHSGPYRRD